MLFLFENLLNNEVNLHLLFCIHIPNKCLFNVLSNIFYYKLLLYYEFIIYISHIFIIMYLDICLMGSPYHNFSCGNIQNVLLGTDFWAKSINQSPYLVRQTSIPDSNGGIPSEAIS